MKPSRSGVFGVPACAVDGRLFWGFDGLAMLRAYLAGDAWFAGPQWADADQRPSLLRVADAEFSYKLKRTPRVSP